jgi:mannose-6-phosphate isomerase-like protein (cupin superfamily)
VAVLQKLRDLTNKLPLLSQDSFCPSPLGGIDYSVDSGSCHGVPLVYSDVCAVQYASLQPNTLFPIHSHQEIEVLVIVKGAGEVITGSGAMPLSTGACVTTRPGDVHGFRAITYVELVGITIPASTSYPKVL